jgi:cation diffusion facilitator CzcD-associated flavoprotein CzcO
MRLQPGARVAIVGAGPSGIVTAKYALDAGFDVTVFEASDDLGGQWYTSAPHSGIWPGMRTNTSRMMTAFSDLPPPEDSDLYPFADQIQTYLRRYARTFGVTEHIRFATPATTVSPGWSVDGEPFDAVVVASGRFRASQMPDGLAGFDGTLLHSFDYPGADAFRGRRVLVYGNGVSGHEIASDVATVTSVVAAYRKPRYVLQKVVDGVPSDWRWYTQVTALQRRVQPPTEWGPWLRERVVRLSGSPADVGAPAPDEDILVAGHSLCQDYLQQIRDGDIICRPGIATVDGRRVTFTDGSSDDVDVIICATGFDPGIPYLSPEVQGILGPDLALHLRTFHPQLPGLALVGQFAPQGPALPLLELQARWICGVWSGTIAPPDPEAMRASITQRPPALDSHHVLALALAEQAGVLPDPRRHPELAELLLFGPMLPIRYRLDGPGARADAADQLRVQAGSSPRATLDADDIALLSAVGYGALPIAALAPEPRRDERETVSRR